MSSRRVLQRDEKMVLRQQAALIAVDMPHFLFDAACDMPKFAEHELTVIELPPHLGELKLAEWRRAEAMPAPAFVDLSGLQLEPLATSASATGGES
jgi:hypothetical protein